MKYNEYETKWTATAGTPSQGKQICMLNTSIDGYHSLKHIYEKYANKLGVTVDVVDKSQLKPALSVNALIFSDGHGSFYENPGKVKTFVSSCNNYDVVFLLGDLTPGDLQTILEIIPEDIPVLAVAGNHDQRDIFESFERITDVHGKAVTLDNGIVIAGLGGSNRYKRDVPRRMMLSQCESLHLSDVIKEVSDGHIDILLSHDKAFLSANEDIAHTGLIGLTKVIKDHPKMRYHLFGHDHEDKTIRYAPSNTIGKCIYQMAFLKL